MGFIDFSFGSGDDSVGKKSTRFKAEGGRTYRVSFIAFKDLNEDGTPNLDNEDSIRFAGCERIYKQGVGYILYKGPAYAEFGQPRHAIATVICVWPCDKDGELDAASFKNGTGYQIQPWVFSPDKYNEIKRKHKRFPLTEHDLSLSCTDTQYQKITCWAQSRKTFVRSVSRLCSKHRPLWTTSIGISHGILLWMKFAKSWAMRFPLWEHPVPVTPQRMWTTSSTMFSK
jgi:hypothetical protein